MDDEPLPTQRFAVPPPPAYAPVATDLAERSALTSLYTRMSISLGLMGGTIPP